MALRWIGRGVFPAGTFLYRYFLPLAERSEPRINPHPLWPLKSGCTLGCIKCSERTPDAALFCFCERTVIDNEIWPCHPEWHKHFCGHHRSHRRICARCVTVAASACRLLRLGAVWPRQWTGKYRLSTIKRQSTLYFDHLNCTFFIYHQSRYCNANAINDKQRLKK